MGLWDLTWVQEARVGTCCCLAFSINLLEGKGPQSRFWGQVDYTDSARQETTLLHHCVMSARGCSSRRDFSPLALPSPTRASLGRTHILLGIFFCPGGLPVVTEFGCTVQHAWGSLPKVADQIKLLLGLIPRNNCRREDPAIGSELPTNTYHRNCRPRGGKRPTLRCSQAVCWASRMHLLAGAAAQLAEC